MLGAIEERRALDTEQVRALLFPFPYGLRKAQDRLLKLHKRGRLDRERVDDGVFAYYRGDGRPGALRHTLGVNWIRIWFEKRLRSWEVLHSWEYEPDYGILRADGFAAVRNVATGKYCFYFVEMDRGTNTFDKVDKYCRLFNEKGYAGRWWVSLTERFPSIIVATVADRRAAAIREQVKKQNSAGLEFRVLILDDIRKEVLGKC